MTDELIEQMARAICCARAQCNGCKGDGAGGCFELTLWDVEARAALAAINLPARDRASYTQGWNEAIEAAAEAYETGTGYAPGKLPSQRIRALTKENSDASSD